MNRQGVGRSLLLAATVIVVGTLATALWVMESPAKQRDRRIDERRTQQLDAIADAVDAWTREHKRLPASLAELSKQPGASLAIVDPVTGTPYEYAAVSERIYRLCASFATSTSDRGPGTDRISWHEKHWMHPAGRHCFDRTSGRADEAAAPASVSP
ncbi:hypothetical protein [Thermomonas carbonis]|uniref:Type II secretion system protein n=1 Tax=Thermomonas carbonis TaxID=1463158 RepID=A0A7G9SPB7_9GAMM|nr:hypothetical protein [Thermomonas carbonis]QNN69692.1 hypothetical protein H9L16_13675 [Thermomonas carbonis]GHB94867.1 hypothetical protein GCM10010080_02680 [Thermomonas carbonis]